MRIPTLGCALNDDSPSLPYKMFPLWNVQHCVSAITRQKPNKSFRMGRLSLQSTAPEMFEKSRILSKNSKETRVLYMICRFSSSASTFGSSICLVALGRHLVLLTKIYNMTTWSLNEVVARRHAITLLEATVFFFLFLPFLFIHYYTHHIFF